MTVGEDRVRIKFNPNSNGTVDEIKQKSAQLIDLCAGMQRSSNPEQMRLTALAMTHYEDAAMWAVKAATVGT